MSRIWHWQQHPAPTQRIGAYTITPIFQSAWLRWPNGGWLWQFPLAVEVIEENGAEDDAADGTRQRLPIADPTRTAVWFLYALLLAFTVAMFLSFWSGRKRPAKKG